MPCFEFSIHEPLADSWGEGSFNSIKTGSSVTPDPIKLLAAVHDHDMNDNATKRQLERQTETWHTGIWRQDHDENLEHWDELTNSETKSMSVLLQRDCQMSRDYNDLLVSVLAGKLNEEKKLPPQRCALCRTAPSSWWRNETKHEMMAKRKMAQIWQTDTNGEFRKVKSCIRTRDNVFYFKHPFLSKPGIYWCVEESSNVASSCWPQTETRRSDELTSLELHTHSNWQWRKGNL